MHSTWKRVATAILAGVSIFCGLPKSSAFCLCRSAMHSMFFSGVQHCRFWPIQSTVSGIRRLPGHHFSSRCQTYSPSIVLGMRCQTKSDAVGKKENLSRKNMGIPKATPRPGGPAALSLGASALSGLPATGRAFTVLGIETSCDDTAVAVVRSDGKVLGEAVARQDSIHEKWGGIVPDLARDAHQAAVQGTMAEALEQAFGAGADVSMVDAVAATVGPGLNICLRVGAAAGRKAAREHALPFVGVHHLEAHCLVARAPALMREGRAEAAEVGQGGVADAAVAFPFLALVISGGHCLLLRVRGVGEHQILGGTLDDTLGEAFDKCARMLGLPVGGGGGPAVEALAREGTVGRRRLPVPMRGRAGCDFSFSGLKQALRQAHRQLRRERGLPVEWAEGEMERTEEMEVNNIRGFRLGGIEGAERARPLPRSDKADLAAAFQEAAAAHLEERVAAAMAACPADTRTLVVVGGVAANQNIAARLAALCERGGRKQGAKKSSGGEEESEWRLAVPRPSLCTDNGVMVAWTAVERLALGISDDPNETDTWPRWPIGELQRSRILES